MDCYIFACKLSLVFVSPVACIAWTVTHEEVFREPRDYFGNRCRLGKTILERIFFYLFTCEYCFSHYVTALFLVLTGFKLLINDWRGYIISEFALVWIANLYKSLFGLLRQNIKKEKSNIKLLDEKC